MVKKQQAAKAAPPQTEDFVALPEGDAPTVSGSDELSNVLYVGHLPHGFYEKQMLEFFSQFGKLTKVRMSRSKKSGRSKHYAFLAFQHPEVAQIAAAAMNGYFLMKQQLVCHVMKKSEVHDALFKGANRTFTNVPWRKIERARHNKDRTPEEHALRVARLLKKDAKRQKRIAEAGIDFEYKGLDKQQPAAATKIKFS